METFEVIQNWRRYESIPNYLAHACNMLLYFKPLCEKGGKYLHLPNEQQPRLSQLVNVNLDPVILYLKFKPNILLYLWTKTYSRVPTCIYNLHTQTFSKIYPPNIFHRFRLNRRHTQPVTRYDLSCMKPMLWEKSQIYLIQIEVSDFDLGMVHTQASMHNN